MGGIQRGRLMPSAADPVEVRIRPATPADFAAIQDIEVQAGTLFRDIGMDAVADDDPPTSAQLSEAACVLVAEVNGAPAGYARVELVGDQSHLEQLSVLPHHGAQGVGTALIEAVVAWARARGDAAVTLTTFRDVAFNAPVYAKRGFAEVPETEWSEAIRMLFAAETAHGLDPAQRVVMRRSIS